MNFDFNTRTFRSLLGENLNTLLIPRFQRDYSWEIEHVSEFIDDLVNNSGEDKAYFFGTILVSGNVNGTKEILEVIDGQQRITTATILLSSIGKILKEKNEELLAEKVWEYIIKTTDDNEKITLLQNDTVDDFFKENIQDLNKSISTINSLDPEDSKSCPDEETKKILLATKYCFDYLQEENLKDKFKGDYIENLKNIRDLLLNSTVVCISTIDKDNANLIFEILNSKGKNLEDIDLIKNAIFKKVNTTQPKDYAIGKWKKIKQNLVERNRIEISTFYHHFWLSMYKKVNKSDLYEQFQMKIKEDEYGSFLDLLVEYSNLYKIISSPKLEDDFSNKKEYSYIVDELKALNDAFNIKQCRIVLLAIFNARAKNIISPNYFGKIIIFLARFHFMYNSLCRERSNAIESKYAKFAVDISSASKKDIVHKKIDEHIAIFKGILPKKDKFRKAFSKLSFSKTKNVNNLIAKYAIYELERIISDNKIVSSTASIEHIFPEAKGGLSTNIGNLTLLELDLNNKCDSLTIEEKLKHYRKSSFHTTKDLINNKPDFNEKSIETRALHLADLFYESVRKI